MLHSGQDDVLCNILIHSRPRRVAGNSLDGFTYSLKSTKWNRMSKSGAFGNGTRQELQVGSVSRLPFSLSGTEDSSIWKNCPGFRRLWAFGSFFKKNFPPPGKRAVKNRIPVSFSITTTSPNYAPTSTEKKKNGSLTPHSPNDFGVKGKLYSRLKDLQLTNLGEMGSFGNKFSSDLHWQYWG